MNPALERGRGLLFALTVLTFSVSALLHNSERGGIPPRYDLFQPHGTLSATMPARSRASPSSGRPSRRSAARRRSSTPTSSSTATRRARAAAPAGSRSSTPSSSSTRTAPMSASSSICLSSSRMHTRPQRAGTTAMPRTRKTSPTAGTARSSSSAMASR